MSANATFQSKVGVVVLSRRSGLASTDITKLFETIKTLLEEGREVQIQGFGKFQPRITTPRSVVSPVLPEGEARVARRRKIRFVMSKVLREEWILEGEDAQD